MLRAQLLLQLGVLHPQIFSNSRNRLIFNEFLPIPQA